VSALLYLDLRFLRNQTMTIVRSPGRLALWIPYLFLLAWFGYSRTLYRGHAQSFSITHLGPSIATAAAGIFLAALGGVLLQASGPRLQGFRSTAEAVLFNNAGIQARTLLLWLQIRKLASTAPRWLFSFVYLLVFVSFNMTLGTVGRILIATFIAAAALMTVELPAYLARRRPRGVAIAWLGGASLAAGVLYGFAGFATFFGERNIAPHVMAAVRVDPGRFVDALVSGPPYGLALLALVPLTLVAIGPLLARDAIPELYAAAAEVQAYRERIRGGRIATGVGAVRSSAAHRIPSGAWTLLWKDWIALRRGRFGLRAFALGVLLWGGIGAAIVYAPDVGLSYTFLSFAAMFVVFVPIRISFGLFAELSKPIWWLSRASLRSRLAVWTISKCWPGALALSALPLVIGVLGGRPALALAAIPLAFAVWWPMHALGLVTYAAFPSRVDVRGPMAMLRVFATMLYLAPPILTSAVIAVLTHNAIGAVAAGLALLVLQGLGFFEISVRRIRENGAALSTLERAA
jgi:hypothetical protein